MVFWDNLLRYPRFFISSMIGLLLLLFNPVVKRSKTNKSIIFILVSFLILLFWVIKAMLTIE